VYITSIYRSSNFPYRKLPVAVVDGHEAIDCHIVPESGLLKPYGSYKKRIISMRDNVVARRNL